MHEENMSKVGGAEAPNFKVGGPLAPCSYPTVHTCSIYSFIQFFYKNFGKPNSYCYTLD